VDAHNVYWAHSGVLYRVPNRGGAVTMMAAGGICGVGIDAHNVYFATSTQVWKKAADSDMMAADTELARPPGTISGGFAIDDQNAYWVSSSDGTLDAVPIGGGATVVLATGLDQSTTTLAVRGPSLYWTSKGFSRLPGIGTGSVNTAPTAGGAITTLRAQLGNPAGIAVNASNVFWAMLGDGSENYGEVLAHALAGGSRQVLASRQLGPTSVAVDDENLYWADRGTPGLPSGDGNGTINKVALVGGTIHTLASNQDAPGAIAVDGQSVYWVNGTGTVNKVAK
jgi:hypothetical protein